MTSTVINLAATPSVAHAFNRFGLGGRPDDLIPADAMSWLSAQITCPDQAPNGPTLAQGLTLVDEIVMAPANSAQHAALGAQLDAGFIAEVQSLLAYAVTTQIPFRERLVSFWANHFAVMAQSGPLVQATAGPYVRDAIRANMTGTVAQMLQAAILHPAMLYSLNAQVSVGPQSRIGLSSAKQGQPQNINENLGRETLELYTLGYDQGYAQADVDALAYLLSGMDVNFTASMPLGAFFNTAKAQPGNFTLMGSTFPGTLPGLMSALHMLGTHPSTYLHLATKLVTHFVSDTPASADIQSVANAFAASGGSLPAAHMALIGLKNAWVPLQKFRTPMDFVVAALRATGATAATLPPNIYGLLDVLGQPVWYPTFPNGWSDLASVWAGPGSLLLRSDWAAFFATHVVGLTPAQVAGISVAPFLGQATRSAMAGCSSTSEQCALLFCSSEFQRR